MSQIKQPKPAPIKQLKREANQPAPISLFIASAGRAFAQGTATDHQQRELYKWLVMEACAKAFPAYYPTDRDTAFVLGRQFVADQINGLLTVDLEVLRRAEA